MNHSPDSSNGSTAFRPRAGFAAVALVILLAGALAFLKFGFGNGTDGSAGGGNEAPSRAVARPAVIEYLDEKGALTLLLPSGARAEIVNLRDDGSVDAALKGADQGDREAAMQLLDSLRSPRPRSTGQGVGYPGLPEGMEAEVKREMSNMATIWRELEQQGMKEEEAAKAAMDIVHGNLDELAKKHGISSWAAAQAMVERALAAQRSGK